MDTASKTVRILGLPAFSNRNANSYNADFYEAVMQNGIEVQEFSFSRAIFGGFDIIHLHWPEKFLNSNYLFKAILWSIMLLICLKTHQLRGGKLVWTVHNLKPHENKHPRCSHIFWTLFLRMVNATFSLSNCNQKKLFDSVRLPKATHHKIIHIPLYHKPDAENIGTTLDDLTVSQIKPYCLFFGRILPYKNVETLIDIFKNDPPINANLIIAGSCENAAYKDELEARIGNATNIKFIGRRITDIELLALIQECIIGIMPFKAIFNSGSLLQFPSYGKPAIAPYSASFAEYGNLFRASPFVLYKENLTKETIENALKNMPSIDSNCPKKLTAKENGIQAADFFRNITQSSKY